MCHVTTLSLGIYILLTYKPVFAYFFLKKWTVIEVLINYNEIDQITINYIFSTNMIS